MAKKNNQNNHYKLLSDSFVNIQDIKKVTKPEQQSDQWKNSKK